MLETWKGEGCSLKCENSDTFLKERKLQLPDLIISPVLASSLSEKLLLIGTACLSVLLPDDYGSSTCWYESQQVFAFQWWLWGETERKIMTLQLHRFGERTQGADKNLNFCVVFSPPLREKDDKYRTWMPTFLIAKEDKDQRKSGSNMERSWFSFCGFPVLSNFILASVESFAGVGCPWLCILFGCCSGVLSLWIHLSGDLCRKYLKGKTNPWIWAVCKQGCPVSHPEVVSCPPT